MKLTHRIINPDETTFGYKVQDGSLSYPIKEDGLWVESIIKALLESGYVLRGLPFNIVTDAGTPIEELPTITYAEAGITDQDLVDMEDMLAGRLPKATMSTLVTIDEESAPIHKFRKGKILIKTREELENFLKSITPATQNLLTETMILPLNAFVAEDALYTFEEYKVLSSELKEKIRSTTMYTYTQYTKLVEVFKALGLKEDYTDKDVVDMYMSFGVPGLRLNVVNISREDSRYIFEANIDYATVAKSRTDAKLKREIPYIRKRTQTYLQADGSYYKTATTKNGNWTPVDAESLHAQALELQNLGSNYITPIELETLGTEEVVKFECTNCEVEYNSSMLVIKNGYAFRELRDTIIVTQPGNTKARLDSEFFNIDKQGLQEHLENETLSTLLTIKTTKECKGTSFKALMQYGANIISAVSLFLNTDDNDLKYSVNPVDAEVTVDLNFDMLKKTAAGQQQLQEAGALNAPMFLNVFKRYLRGNLDPSDRLYATVDYIISGLLDGTINMGFMAQGATLDKRLQHESLYTKYLVIARKYLGLSFQDIYERIYDVDITTTYVELEGNGLKLRIPIVPLENAAKAYDADRDSYRLKQVEEARILGYITKAYTELTTTKKFKRHVAFESLTLDLTDKYKSSKIMPIIDKLEQWANDVIDNNYLERDPKNRECKKYSRQFAIDALFSIIVKGSVQMYPIFNKPSGQPPIVLDFGYPQIHHPVVDVSEVMEGIGTAKTLRNLATTTWEGTAIATDFAVNIAGRFLTYYVNAIVTPEYIIPKTNFKIPEVCLEVGRWNTAGAKGAERGKLITAYELLPKSDIEKIQAKSYRCFTTAYSGNCFPIKDGTGELVDIKKMEGNIYQYLDEADEELKLQNMSDEYDGKYESPTHPLYLKYPKLLELDSYEEYLEDEQEGEKVDGSYMYRVMPCQVIDRETITARSSLVRTLFAPKVKKVESRVKVEDFTGFDPEDFLANDNVLDIFAPMEGEAALYGDNVKNEVIFMDGSTVSAKDIPAVADKGTYQVRKISSFRYLVATAKGTYIIVEVK